MSSFMDSAAWQEVRTYSVLVLVINNEWQLLLFLQAGPIMEDKLNKMWPLSLRVSRFRKGRYKPANAGLQVAGLLYSNAGGGGSSCRNMVPTEKEEIPAQHMSTALLRYLTCETDMTLFSH